MKESCIMRAKNQPMHNSTYSFIGKVNGKPMEFVSEEEYREYVEPVSRPIEIIKRHFVEYKQLKFCMKVVFYKRTTDNLYFVYRVSKYAGDEPYKETYTFASYWDAFGKYKDLGGK